jgi:hypothetical protein
MCQKCFGGNGLTLAPRAVVPEERVGSVDSVVSCNLGVGRPRNLAIIATTLTRRKYSCRNTVVRSRAGAQAGVMLEFIYVQVGLILIAPLQRIIVSHR